MQSELVPTACCIRETSDKNTAPLLWSHGVSTSWQCCLVAVRLRASCTVRTTDRHVHLDSRGAAKFSELSGYRLHRTWTSLRHEVWRNGWHIGSPTSFGAFLDTATCTLCSQKCIRELRRCCKKPFLRCFAHHMSHARGWEAVLAQNPCR